MNENFDEIKNSIKTLIDLKLLPVIKNKLNDHHEFINKCRIEITQLQKVVDSASYSSRSESISKVIGINENLKQLIADEQYTEFCDIKFTSIKLPKRFNQLEDNADAEQMYERKEINNQFELFNDRYNVLLGNALIN